MTARVPILVLILWSGACGRQKEPAVVDLDADTDHDGIVDASREEDRLEENPPGAIVLVNLDDDDRDGSIDCQGEGRGAAEDDLVLVVLQEGFRSRIPKGGGARLLLSGQAEAFRVFLDGLPVLGRVGDGLVEEHQLDPAGEGSLRFRVEGLRFNRRATLKVELTGADRAILEADRLVLSTAPFLMYSNLDPADRLFVAVTDDNQALLDGLEAAVGAGRVRKYDAALYGGEIWFQDEFEFAYQQAPAGPMQLVLDAVTDWGLDPFPEEELLGPGFGWLERGERPPTIHTDSFGNLECSPPLSVAGVGYPFGRIYYGGRPGGKQMAAGLRAFLDAQQVQSPVELDVTWLIVGHVDEVLSFVPDSGSQRGFKVLIADYQVTVEILEGLDPGLRIPRYADVGFSTVGELLKDPTMELSAEIDQKHMRPLVTAIREAFGLADGDIIRVPILWTLEVDNALALIPNMVNLAVFNHDLLIADPFFRALEGPEEDANGNFRLDDGEDLDGDGLLNTLRDPLAAYLAEQLPEGLTPHFLDDWTSYHMQGGEVHCATNIQRVPRNDLYWWQVE